MFYRTTERHRRYLRRLHALLYGVTLMLRCFSRSSRHGCLLPYGRLLRRYHSHNTLLAEYRRHAAYAATLPSLLRCHADGAAAMLLCRCYFSPARAHATLIFFYITLLFFFFFFFFFRAASRLMLITRHLLPDYAYLFSVVIFMLAALFRHIMRQRATLLMAPCRRLRC